MAGGDGGGGDEGGQAGGRFKGRGVLQPRAVVHVQDRPSRGGGVAHGTARTWIGVILRLVEQVVPVSGREMGWRRSLGHSVLC